MRKFILIHVLIISFVFLSIPIIHSAEEEKVRLLVIPLIAKGGIPQDIASLLTDLLSVEIHRSGKFDILNREDMKAVLDEKEFEQAVGSDDNKSKLKNVAKLAVNKVIAGSIGALGEKYIISIRLINEDGENEIVAKESCKCPIEELDKTIEHISYKFLKYLGDVTQDGSIRQANYYYDRKEYAEAVKWYHKAAEQGDARAQYNLAYMYGNGKGVQKDDYEAVKWLRKAAEQGDVSAQNNLGVMCEKGRGVQKDFFEAVKWLRKAAEQGNANAQKNLGIMYEKGRGVQKDNYEAVKWYHKSAEQGDARAQYNLAYMYGNGKGVQQDDYEAVKWYHKAAEYGNKNAKNTLKRNGFD